MKRIKCLFSLAIMSLAVFISLPVHAVQKTFDMGKQHPKEVVATVDSSSKTVTLSMEYVYDPASEGEELPNPGYMTDQRQSELLTYMESNNLTDYSLVIDNGVKSIGTNAFSGSSAFNSVNFYGRSLEKIGANAFSNMSNLTSVDLSNTKISKIDANTFADCAALESVIIPDSVKSIVSGAFQNSGVKTITGGNNVTTVGAGSFSGSNSIMLDTSSKAIINYDWPNSNYKEVSLSDGTKMHIVTFISGSSLPNSKIMVKNGEKVEAPTINASGYTFEGWFSDDAFTKPYSFETPVTASISLYGKWHSDSINIILDAKNGMSNVIKTIPYGGKLERPADPINGDKVFIGWFRDSEFVTPVDFANDTFDRDTTLYAKYVDATYFTVTFDTDDGTEIEDQSIKAGKTVTRPADPEKEDYTFDGWYNSSEFTKKWDFDKNVISADTTIYAKWKSNFVSVKFDTNGGGMIESQSIERGSTAKRPADPVKDNCEFLGWFADSGATEIFNFDAKVTEDTTVYAGWNQTAFTVNFESNGGSAVGAIVTNPNTLIARPPDPTKEGYHLEAWCSDSALATVWDFNANQVNADITLYAKWSPGTTPGVTNPGAAIPQTGDPTGVASVFSSLATTVGAAIIGKKNKWF